MEIISIPFSLYNGINKKEALKDLMARDSYLSAQEALKLGMVDYMIHKPKDLYSKINL